MPDIKEMSLPFLGTQPIFEPKKHRTISFIEVTARSKLLRVEATVTASMCRLPLHKVGFDAV